MKPLNRTGINCRSNYCDEVGWVLAEAKKRGIHAYFLDHRPFMNGTYGPACCGHPSAQVDTAIARFTASVLAAALDWNTPVF